MVGGASSLSVPVRGAVRDAAHAGRTRDGAPRADPSWRLLVLRAFELTHGGQAVPISAGAQRVLAFLALNDRPLSRAYVAGVLWPDTSDRRAGGSLRSAIWDLRLADRDLVDAAGGSLRLAPHVGVDLRVAMALAGPILDPRQPCPDSTAEHDLLRCDLLSDWYDEWVTLERALPAGAPPPLESLCGRLIRERQLARAIDAGVAAVAAEPLREAPSASSSAPTWRRATGEASGSTSRMLAAARGAEPRTGAELQELVGLQGGRA
jgi:hypothetical protein